MNNKTTNILLAFLVAVAVVGIVVLNQGEEPEEPKENFGFGIYNDLGQSGMTQATTAVGIEGGGTKSSTTAYQVLSEGNVSKWAEIEIDEDNAYEVRLYFGTTTFSGGSTTTYTSATKAWDSGRTLATSSPIYRIDSDNLWRGEVWAISTTSTSTLRYRYK